MKTLYVRIVMTFILVSLVSSLLALVISNLYYLTKLRDYNDQKIAAISEQIKALYLESPQQDFSAFFTHVAGMGFQIYAVDEKMNSAFYGAPFKHQEIEPAQIRRVIEGERYNGVLEERNWLTIVGMFENSIRNSVGLPIESYGQKFAMFVRPNLDQQIGEVRIVVALLLGLTFLFSILLIIVLTRTIVKPVRKLTEATNRIVKGDYRIDMDVSRRDEIGNLARHFTHMAHTLKQVEDMRQEFVANVSHEIQSPLTSIQGFAQAVLDPETTTDDKTRYLRIIEQESSRLSTLSKQLLTLASLDKETQMLKPSSFRLDEQIRQILIVTEWQWNEKQIAIEPILPETTVIGDPQMLYQVWLNLIINSIKFTESGGEIRISIVQEPGKWIVAIRDTGIGISQAELPHLFDRFYKSDKARNRNRSGSGLGLAIVQKIVHLHGGTVEVTSEFGRGTTIYVKLPR